MSLRQLENNVKILFWFFTLVNLLLSLVIAESTYVYKNKRKNLIYSWKQNLKEKIVYLCQK